MIEFDWEKGMGKIILSNGNPCASTLRQGKERKANVHGNWRARDTITKNKAREEVICLDLLIIISSFRLQCENILEGTKSVRSSIKRQLC